MKSHTGGVVSFGTGALMSKSSKQKLNTKSSTEAEMVGVSDYLPRAIWAKKFMEGQGYTLKESRFYQDNQSTIRFEKNDRSRVAPTPATLTLDISSSKTDWRGTVLTCNTVRLSKCWRISSRSHYKEAYSGDLERLSWGTNMLIHLEKLRRLRPRSVLEIMSYRREMVT